MSASWKQHFSRFLGDPALLHASAHSHHPWPDVSFAAQQQAWLDAARLADDKWDLIFGEVLPKARRHLARHLNLPSPETLCFAANTHELLLRLLSCIERKPLRVLTTDGEFHSFSRQLQRLEEAGLATAQRVATEPYDTFAARFAAAAAAGGHDLVYFSHCFFNSGFVVADPAALVAAVRDPQTLVVIDGYHAFMAVPVDLAPLAGRAFYLGGGYKYVMAGEGAAYIHCPAGYAERPVNTGWFAGFDSLSSGGRLSYGPGGERFMGATYEPVGLYRFNAVMDWLQAQNLDAKVIHAHVEDLQRQLLEGLTALRLPGLGAAQLIPPAPLPRGNFLCFRDPQAGEHYRRLKAGGVLTDYREDRLRIGLGIYHDSADIEELLRRFKAAL
jgi:kynureninase